jgi:hypothetical protein
MRIGPLVAGVAALIVAALLLVLALLGTSATVPQAGSYLEVSPHLIGSGTMTVSWSGATSTTQVGIYNCGSSACSFTSPSGCNGLPCTAAGGPVASGTGGSGSLHTQVQSGTNYAVVQSGTAQPLSTSTSLLGLTYVLLIGIIILILGGLLLGLSRGRSAPRPARAPKPRAVRAPEPEMEPEEAETGYVDEEGPSEMATPAPRRTYVAPPPTPEELEEPPEPEPPAPMPSPTAQRAPIQCAKCGRLNEPWLTNCRYCRRPLTSTASG